MCSMRKIRQLSVIFFLAAILAFNPVFGQMRAWADEIDAEDVSQVDDGDHETGELASGESENIFERPMMEGDYGFEELREINPDVFGWINIFGTNIDYPLVQDRNGNLRRYEHTNARGEPSMAGAIFLDTRNNTDLYDFNTIIYGHDMARNVMFGEINLFRQENVFDAHRYGMIFNGETHYGIELFAFLIADAHDFEIYNPTLSDPVAKAAFLERIATESDQYRELDGGVSIDDRIVLLSTCTRNAPNLRYILVGRIVEHVPIDPFDGDVVNLGTILLDEVGEIGLATGSFLIILLTVSATLLILRLKSKKEEADAKAIPPKIKKKKPTILGEILFLSGKIAMVLTALSLLFIFVFGATQISDASMAPAMREGDIVFFQRIRNEIDTESTVVVQYAGQTQVRRVIAVAGDVVDITSDGLMINGQRLREMHIFEETTQFVEGSANFPMTIEEGQVFLLGDSRRSAQDSRYYGAVPVDRILGSVVTIVRRRNL